jgi:peptidoglycan/LPS O-acetylase OafA/YrhL
MNNEINFTQKSASPFRLLHPKYRPDIDGLRAFAVLAVVAFHAFPTVLKGGFIGVDVFFVISGYLISTILFENFDRGTFCFTEFYARRIKRIFPALIVVLLSCFAFGWFALFADEFKQLDKHIAAGAGFVSNIVLWNEAGYFDNSADTKPLLHLWSLGIEEQFYIAWPLLIWVAWKRKYNILTVTILVILISFLLNIWGIKHQDAIETFYSPQTRFWELLSGSLLAWLTLYRSNTLAFVEATSNDYLYLTWLRKNTAEDKKMLSNIFSLIGFLLLAYGFLYINKELAYPGMWALIPVLGTVLIISAGSKNWINRIILSNKIAIWIGLISFPLYLWHWPLLSFARIIEGGVTSRSTRLAAVVLSVVLAWLTYKLVENPVRLGGHSKLKTAILFIIMTTLGAFSSYIYFGSSTSNGSAKATNNSKELGWETPVGSNEQIALCRNLFPERNKMISKKRDDNFCYLQRNSVPNVLLVGDSINLSLFPGLSRYGDYNILLLSASTAAPFYNVRTTEIGDTIRQNNFKLTNQALDYALSNDNIKVVVLASKASAALTDPKSLFKITDVNNPQHLDARSIFSSSLSFTVKKLLDKGKSVIYVLPNPTLSFDIKTCALRPFKFSDNFNKSCREFSEKHLNSTKDYKEWVTSALKDFPQVKLFDAAIPFCDDDYCYGIKDGQILYRDRGHLSISGSNIVAPYLHDLIRKSLADQK